MGQRICPLRGASAGGYAAKGHTVKSQPRANVGRSRGIWRVVGAADVRNVHGVLLLSLTAVRLSCDKRALFI